MISSKKAQSIIFNHTLRPKTIAINTNESLNNLIKQNIYSDRDYPPFDRSKMDGIAFNKKAINQDINKFKIIGIQFAGTASKSINKIDQCFEISTGAALPRNTDCVIPYEMINIDDKMAKINKPIKFKPYFFIDKKGSLVKKQELLINKNTIIGPNQISILNSVGVKKVKTAKKPTITIISTGDELIKTNTLSKYYQIRESNIHTCNALLNNYGFNNNYLLHTTDSKVEIKKAFIKSLKSSDLIITIGGASKGKTDFISDVLKDLKANILVSGVNQKPGKPLIFSTFPNNKIHFGLPGNPVSSQICLIKYVIPFLIKSLGSFQEIYKFVRLNDDISFSNGLTNFVCATLRNNKGMLIASPISIKSSFDFISISNTSGFIECDKKKHKKDQLVKFYNWSGYNE